jgi:hypothetical protein
VVDRRDDASCLLGLEGLAVECVMLTAVGVKIVQLVTDDPDAPRCPACRAVLVLGKGWVRTRRNRACRPGAVRGCAPRPGCEPRWQWRSRTAGISLRRLPRTGVLADGGARAVVARGAVELAEPKPTSVLGMDETRFGRPRWLPDGEHPDGRRRWARTDPPWETGFVDITGEQALLGRVDGRTSVAVQAWLAARTPEFRAAVEVVVLDPHAGYAAAVRAPGAGRHARPRGLSVGESRARGRRRPATLAAGAAPAGGGPALRPSSYAGRRLRLPAAAGSRLGPTATRPARFRDGIRPTTPPRRSTRRLCPLIRHQSVSPSSSGK